MFTSLIDNSDNGSTGAAAYDCLCGLCGGAPLPQLQGAAAADQAPLQAFSGLSTAHLGGHPGSLFAGSQWSGRDAEGRVVITYSFANAGSQYSADQANFRSTLGEFSDGDKALARAALASIEAVCNVRFVEVADSGAQCGQLRYAYSQAPTSMGYAGFAFYPSSSEVGGNIWIATAQTTEQWAFYRPNLILHETLHAIGLKHPFDGSNKLASELNLIPNTVMSYSPIAGTRTGWLSEYPSEPMPLDVLALQALYGTASRNAGDTVYDLSQAGWQSGFRVIWDSAGTDTLDAARVGSAVSLDLRDGTRSDLGAEVRATGYLEGGGTVGGTYSATLAIAAGVTIENAIGSAFSDLLLGNEGDNILWGEAGDDLFDGLAGNDRLFGGAGDDLFFVTAGGRKLIDGGMGSDRVVFAGRQQDYTLVHEDGQVHVSRTGDPASACTLLGIERIEFSDAAVALAQAQPQHVQLLDGLQGQAFRLYNAAFDRLPDADGLAYHTRSLQGGAGLTEVARQFMASPEFSSRYGAPGDEDFVTQLYHNVLDRAPDSGGLAYHLERLAEGASRADVLVGFSESPENQVAVMGVAEAAAALFPM